MVLRAPGVHFGWVAWAQPAFRKLPSNPFNKKVTRDLFAHGFRELRNVAEYAAVVGRGRRLDLSCLPPEFREAPSSFSRSRRPLTEDDERARIVAALETCDGHRGDAAELLGMHRTTLWRKLKQYGLD